MPKRKKGTGGEEGGGKRLKEKYDFFLVDALHVIFNLAACTRKQLAVCLGEAVWAQEYKWVALHTPAPQHLLPQLSWEAPATSQRGFSCV